VFGPVRSLNATTQSESSIIVTWDPPNNGGGAVEIKNYRVTSTPFIYEDATETSILLNDLVSSTHYDIDVATVGMDGRLGASMSIATATSMLSSAVMRALQYSVIMKRELYRKANLSGFKIVFVPILTYGYESWVMTKAIYY